MSGRITSDCHEKTFMKVWSGKLEKVKQAAYFKSGRKEENGEFS